MRVVHKDGRIGTHDSDERRGIFTPDDGSAPGGFYWLEPGDPMLSELRPLGPIEEELLRFDWRTSHPFDLSGEAFDLLNQTYPDPVDWAFCAELFSEALEACERIWVEHGVSL